MLAHRGAVGVVVLSSEAPEVGPLGETPVPVMSSPRAAASGGGASAGGGGCRTPWPAVGSWEDIYLSHNLRNGILFPLFHL